ncbi:MAG: pyridoxal 5'-phosphate synthase glutaminase subunit PdxT [candidate division Zixibacteria bacterium]|nr:pyridoxal 5'-phosphate synthase glutaminase subunit PdxT [candidate division Zixibacteria bacterium]
MSLSKNISVGVLALQGDYEAHKKQLQSLAVKAREVRLAGDLKNLDALIIPGGETTTMDKLIDRFKLRQPLINFCRSKPVFGTCAGLIMLSKKIEDNQSGVEPLGLLDIDVLRNGYGRQVFSFEEEININLGNGKSQMAATFIRAPKITRIGKGVKVLGEFKNEPVLISQNKVLASSFHAELGQDTSLLRYFLKTFASG